MERQAVTLRPEELAAVLGGDEALREALRGGAGPAEEVVFLRMRTRLGKRADAATLRRAAASLSRIEFGAGDRFHGNGLVYVVAAGRLRGTEDGEGREYAAGDVVGAREGAVAEAVEGGRLIGLPRPVFERLVERSDARPSAGSGGSVRPVPQLDASDCGPTCLAMIGRRHGRRWSMGELRRRTCASARGVTLADLARAAEGLGYSTRGIKATYEALEKLQLPAILHWDGNHFVVLERVRPRRARIVDPAGGRRWVEREEFLRRWNGHALELAPGRGLADSSEEVGRLHRFLRYVLPYKWLLAQVFLASLLLQILGLATPLFTQQIIDRVVVTRDMSFLHVMAIGMAIVALAAGLVRLARAYLASYLVARIDFRMVTEFLSHLFSLPLPFFSRYKIGDLLSRVGDNARIRRVLTATTIETILDVLFVGVYVTLMFLYSVPLSFVALGILPVYVLLTLATTPIFKRIHRRSLAADAEQASALIEALHGIETIKAAAAEREIRWNWQTLFARSLRIGFAGTRIGIGLSFVGNYALGMRVGPEPAADRIHLWAPRSERVRIRAAEVRDALANLHPWLER